MPTTVRANRGSVPGSGTPKMWIVRLPWSEPNGLLAVTCQRYVPAGEPVVFQLNLAAPVSNVGGIAGPVPAPPGSGVNESNVKLSQRIGADPAVVNVCMNIPGSSARTLENSASTIVG